MVALVYRARTADGRVRSGRSETGEVARLRDELRQQGLYLVETRSPRGPIFLRKRVARRELIYFAYQLQTALRSGLPLLASLEELARQTRGRYFRTVIEDLGHAVYGGSTLTQALERHPGVFSQEFVQMVHAGEASGRIDEALERLVRLLEWHDELRAQVRQLVAYPSLVLLALVGLVVLLLTFVIPRFGGVLEGLGVGLPLPTRMLLAGSELFLSHWIAIVAAGTLFLVGVSVARRASVTRRWIDRWVLRVPILGDLRRSLVSSQVCHFLGAFVDAGVPIGEGLGLISKLSGNLHVQARLLRIRDRIFEGETLSRAFQEARLFPSLVLRMIAIGEETGGLPEALQKAEEYYDREIPRRVRTLMDVSGPLLTVLIAGILCFVVLAVLLPIYKMYGAIS